MAHGRSISSKKLSSFDHIQDPSIKKKMLLRTNPKLLTDKKQKALREEVIAAKKKALVSALKMPPALNQFTKYLDDQEAQEYFDLFSNFKPENRKERLERLEKEKTNGRVGEKPIIVKSGVRHVTDLIEQKKAQLVLIACDTDPIEVVLFLPTLCKKLEIPFVLVKSKYDLGKLVNRKKCTTVCLTGCTADKKTKFQSLIKKANGRFMDNYEVTMANWGQPA
ncbi:60S ribosomal protein L7A, partial [Pseudoloma neurophilia]